MAVAEPFVSVIVPVFDDAERLRLCLRALDRQTYPRESYEVIVVDNGSAQSVAHVAANFGQARLTHEKRPGSYAARNRGLSVARGEVLAFTDADCVPWSNWIERGVAELRRAPGCGLVAGRINLFARDPERPTAVELYEGLTALRQREYVERGGFGATANLFTLRTVFEQVGPFDQTIKSGGDLEWGRRVAAHRYTLIYADDVCVDHPARRSLGELYRKVVRIIGGFRELNRAKKTPYTGLGKGFVIDSLPPIRASVGAWRDPTLVTTTHKLKVIGVLFFVQYAQAWERLRLSAGGEARR